MLIVDENVQLVFWHELQYREPTLGTYVFDIAMNNLLGVEIGNSFSSLDHLERDVIMFED
jgi:hypothetical protein